MTNKQLLEAYLENNLDRLYRLAFSYAANRHDAEDIICESVIKALQAIDTLREPDYLGTWMYRIVINTAKTMMKRNSKVIFFDPLSDEWQKLPQHTIWNDSYESIHFKDIVACLNRDQRLLVVMRYLEDMSLATIADLQGENVNTIKTRLYRALKKLRKEMEEHDA